MPRARAPQRTRPTRACCSTASHLVQDAWRAGRPVEIAAIDDASRRAPEGAALAAALEQRRRRGRRGVATGCSQAMSPVRRPSGIVAIAASPRTARRSGCCARPAASSSLVAVDVQDPGNVGAIVRAAEAGGATGLVLCGASADPFGWKALRGSMGSAAPPAHRAVPVSTGAPRRARHARPARASSRRSRAAAPRCSSADLSGPVAFVARRRRAGASRGGAGGRGRCASRSRCGRRSNR